MTSARSVAGRRAAIYGASVTVLLLAWWVLSLAFPPIFFPSPVVTFETGVELLLSGDLPRDMAVSLVRILVGWAVGGILGVVLGILLGRIAVLGGLALPVIEYFRFIPPVTLVTLFIIWFGIGELSKIVLILWTTVFIVTVNVMAGAMSVREGVVRAARSLGANERQVLLRVVVPETVPYMVVGLQVGLSNAFMTIVAAEMLAAQSGVGFMIWDAQIYTQTERIFVAFVALSFMGFCTDRLFYGLSRYMFAHYKVA